MEIRKHYFLDEYVIIATERAKRPHQFEQEKEDKEVKKDFFAPGNEDQTPPEIYRFPKDSKKEDWKIRVFPNKFPFLKTEGEPKFKTDNSFFTHAPAYGYHEVLVEAPELSRGLADLQKDELIEVFKTYNRRIEELSKKENIEYVLIFKNSGSKAGTSIAHTHTQIAAYNMVPIPVQKKEEATRRSESCPYCDIWKIEKDSERKCYENERFVAFTPYASRFPFELWILPKSHKVKMSEFDDKDYEDLCELMSQSLRRLKTINAPYNFYIHYGIKDMHLNITLIPRLATWAGFEHGSGTIINTMSPEEAARFYRSE